MSGPERLRTFKATHVLAGGEVRAGLALTADLTTGRIVALAAPGAGEGGAGPPAGTETVDLGRRVLVPGGINSHAHAFQILLRGRADDACSFREWVDAHLYPLVESLDDEDLETSMLFAFAEMARSGTTAVGEFFYLHDGRGNQLDELAIRCARRVGLRVALLRTLYDRGTRLAQRRFHETVPDAVASTRALARAWRGDPMVSIAPAPHSLHGASAEMIQAGSALANELGTPFHIHLAEQRGDLVVSSELYGTTPLRALRQIGVLGPRLVIVHGCWLDPEELEMLGAARAGLAYNPSANQFLGDGMTAIETAIRAGATVSLGCDGPGGNNGVDIFAEMRAAELLARVRLTRMGVLGPLGDELGGPSPVRPEPVEGPTGASPRGGYLPFLLGTRNGGRNLGIEAGELAPGAAADFVALDPDDLALAPHHDVDTRALLRNLVYAGEARSAIREVVVGGEVVVRGGRTARIDPAEIRERVRRWERKARR